MLNYHTSGVLRNFILHDIKGNTEEKPEGPAIMAIFEKEEEEDKY